MKMTNDIATMDEMPIWQSIETTQHVAGYAVCEAESRFWHERMAENILRVVGVTMVLIGYVQWFIPATLLQGDPVMARSALSILFMGTGVGVYLFASRGFRKVLRLDLSNRSLHLARVNTKNHSLVRREISMDEIESIYVKRASERHGLATLYVRVKTGFVSFAALHGEQEELESLHKLLCRDTRLAKDCAPKRVRPAPARVPAAKTPRPGQRKKRGRMAASAIAAV